MAFPYLFHETFESGTKGNFDTESDLGNRLDFPHQEQLGGAMMPWRGAFCCRVNLGKINTDAYLSETIAWPDETQRWGRFRLFIGNDVQFGNDLDRVTILQFYSGDPDPDLSTREARLVLARIEPLGTVLVSEMEAEPWDAFASYFVVPHGEWITVEYKRTVGTTNPGTMALILPAGWGVSARQVEGDNIAFRLGAIDQTGEISGHLYFDDMIVDVDRLWPDPEAPANGRLSGNSLFLTQSGFAFFGPGEIEHVSVIDGGSGTARVRVYDTDYPTRLPAGGLRFDLLVPAASATAQTTNNRVPFRRGAYVELSGTNPQAIVRLGAVASDGGQG